MLYDLINEYLADDIYPFHMPGHKRDARFFPDGFLTNGMFKYDITELDGLDNLHAPSGIIARAQENIASIYGADETHIMVNGSTGGIVAAIAAHAADGDTVLLARNCHRSVYSGVYFSGAKAAFVYPEQTEYGFCGGVSPEAVRAALEDAARITAVVITSPTYEGLVSDVAAIAEVVHKAGAVLIVDEAHGAHFRFHEAFPRSALELGADIVIHSLHKTLPALSQTALLHVKGGRVNRVLLKKMLTFVQSSSPSYVFMAQAEYVVKLLENDKTIFERYVERLRAFREAERAARNADDDTVPPAVALLPPAAFLSPAYAVHDLDLARLTFITHPPITGRALELHLRDNHRVQIELSGARHIVAITSPADTDEGFARLLFGIRAVKQNKNFSANSLICDKIPRAETGADYRHAIRAASTTIKLEAIGQNNTAAQVGNAAISADFITPYPPGIPLLIPGEIISPDILRYINLLLQSGIIINGIGGDSASGYTIKVLTGGE